MESVLPTYNHVNTNIGIIVKAKIHSQITPQSRLEKLIILQICSFCHPPIA